MVYEAYPLTVDSNNFSINNICTETCILDGIIPSYLRIEGNGSSLKINKITTLDKPEGYGFKAGKSNLQDVDKLAADRNQATIQKLNDNIKKKKLRWVAGETSVSKLTYEQKKKLFSSPDGKPPDHLPNLQGFEYYKGGIFELLPPGGGGPTPSPTPKPTSTPTPIISNIAKQWDWRNVHGENWLTSVKDQGSAGTCWAHANIGAFESLINLYFNQHLNIDLSEQMLVDCINNPILPLDMSSFVYPQCYGQNMCYPGIDYCIESIHGIADEQCDPYAQRDLQPGTGYCTLDYICNNWQDRVWKISGFHDYKFGSDRGTPACPYQTMNPTENDLKKILITKGPTSSAYIPWNHAMILVGYEADPLDNQTIWIYKNSWGTNWGGQGYLKMKVSLVNIAWGSLPLPPVIPPAGQSYQIACVDKDHDGYCNWGISENKPSTCPNTCKPEKDCDDSSPNLGPYDNNFNCSSITPTPTPSPFVCTACAADLKKDVDCMKEHWLKQCIASPSASLKR